MRVVLWALFFIVVILIATFLNGQSNSVKLKQICDLEVPWYDAVFLDSVNDKAGCEKYQ